MVNRLVVLANIASYRREDIGACRVGRERRSSDLLSPFSRQEWVRIAGLVSIRSGRGHEILEGVIRQFPPEVGNRKRSALAIRLEAQPPVGTRRQSGAGRRPTL